MWGFLTENIAGLQGCNYHCLWPSFTIIIFTSFSAVGVSTLLVLKMAISIRSLFLKWVSSHACQWSSWWSWWSGWGWSWSWWLKWISTWFVLYGEARGIHNRFAWCSILKIINCICIRICFLFICICFVCLCKRFFCICICCIHISFHLVSLYSIALFVCVFASFVFVVSFFVFVFACWSKGFLCSWALTVSFVLHHHPVNLWEITT